MKALGLPDWEERALRKAIDLCPSAERAIKVAWKLVLEHGRAELALETAKKAIALCGGKAEASSLGGYFARFGLTDLANACRERARQLPDRPGPEPAWFLPG